jgi:nitrogen fixation negative regulator NifL
MNDPPRPGPPPRDASAGPLRLLLIEDVPADAELCVRELQRAGLDVRADIASTFQQAEAKFAAGDYDLVLSDYRFPGGTGLEVVKSVRESQRDIPLIVVSGTLGDEAAVELLKHGAADFVLKDRMSRLPFAVRRALQEKAERQARRQAEEQQQYLFRALHASLNEIYIFDAESLRFEFVSAGAQSNLQYTMEALRNMTPLDLKPEFTRGTFAALLRPLRQGEVPVLHFETVHRRADGSLYPAEVHLQLLEQAGRRVFLAVIMDITERRKTEQQMRLQVAALESAANAIVITDASGRIEWVNPAFEKLTGYSALEVIGQNPRALKSGRHPQEYYAELWRTILSGRVWQGELINRRKDGTLYPEEMTITPVRDAAGKVTHFIAVKQDVTERHLAQEALQRSEARYRELIENSPYGMYRSRTDGSIDYCNPAFVKMLGYDSREEVLRLNMAKDVYADPLERQRVQEENRRAGTVKNFEVEWKRKDDKRIRVRLSGRLLQDESGEYTGAEIMVEDVTEQRALEQQFRQAQKMEAVGRLAGGVAHDFNNMLNVILGYADLLLDGVSPEDPRHKKLTEIRKAGDRAAALTRQLLAFSRKQVMQPVVLSLNDLVRDTSNMLARLIGEHIQLKTVLEKDLWPVKADPGQLDQVLINLAVNARDAMLEGGMLTIETRNVNLDEHYARLHGIQLDGARDFVLLTVSDTGAGMTQEVLSHIFEPFFTTKEKGKGTGLGLATVYGIVKQSGGFIWAYSEPGQGASFKVYLPRVQEAVQPRAETALPAVEHDVAAAPRTILIVEDEEALRNLLLSSLQETGFQVLAASNPAEALALTRDHAGQIDLLITDMVLPGMDGQNLARNVAALRPGIRVIFMSGYTETSFSKPGGAMEGKHFLQKPFSHAALLEKIRALLAGPPRPAS